MVTNQKRVTALALLSKTGIWRMNYEPPFLRLQWKLGFDVPPPHFASFLNNALSMGGSYSIIMGIVMWIFEDRATEAIAGRVIFGGVFVGLAMASYYAYGRRKYNLPYWKELSTLP